MVVHVFILLMLFLMAKGDGFPYTLRLHQEDPNGAIVGYDFSNDSFMMFRHCLEDFSTKTCYADYDRTTIVSVHNETEVRKTSESWCFACESIKTNNTIACHRSDSVYPQLNYLSIYNSDFNSNCFVKTLPTTVLTNDSSNQCFICSRAPQTTTEYAQYSQTTEVNSGLATDSTLLITQTTLSTSKQLIASTLSTTSNSSLKEVIESTKDHTRTLTNEISSDSVTYPLHSTTTTKELAPTEHVVLIATTTSFEEHTSENTSVENNFQNNKDYMTQDNTIYIIIGVIMAVVLIAIIIISVIVYRKREQTLLGSKIPNKDSRNSTSIEANDGVYVDVFQNLCDASSTSVFNNEYTYGVVDGHKEMSSSVTDNRNDRVTIASVSNLTYDDMTLTSKKESVVLAEKRLVGSPVEPIYSIVNKSIQNSETVDQGRRNLSVTQEHD